MGQLLKRILTSIPLLIGMTMLAFIIMKAAPGDPTAFMMDPNMSIEDQAQIRENLGLDQPIFIQYGKWLNEVLKGNLGYSYLTKQPVTTAILERLPATLILSFSSLFIILFITFPLGLWSGYRKDSFFDNAVTILSFIGSSLPTFWIGLIFILFFSLKLNIFPTSGFLDPQLSDASFLSQSINIAYHLCLPLLTIVIGGIAGLTRYHRFGIISILSQDYIKASRARGINEKTILYKHAFKNAALPIVTILGLSLPGLISGSFVIEYIFSWPGMGQLGINAVFSRDYPILMGTLLFSSILIIVGNLCADLAYKWIDPRIEKT